MKDEKRLSDKFSVDIFSSRELDVLACVANGHSYKRAALILKISDRTVNAHIRNICGKIGAGAKEQVIYFLDKNNALDEIRERLMKSLKRFCCSFVWRILKKFQYD
jgi:DNA-binding CsgD family transcriptional regulator